MEKKRTEGTIDWHKIQLELEEDMRVGGIDRFNKNNERAINSDEASATGWYRRLTKSFVEPLSEGIQTYLDFYNNKPNGRKATKIVALMYLNLLDPKVSAYIATKVIFDNLSKDNITIQSICEKVGSRIEDQVRFSKLEKVAKKYIDKVKLSLAQNNSSKYSHKRKVFSHIESKLSTNEGSYHDQVDKWSDWPLVHKIHIGARLIDIFVDVVTYKGEPIILKEVVNKGMYGKNKSVARFVPSKYIVEWIGEYREALQEMSPCYAPCVVQPRDWESPTVGGFHTPEVASTVHLVKVQDDSILKMYTKDKMPVVYSSINALQRTEWQVNKNIFKVADEVMQRDLALGLPQREPYEFPPCPISDDPKLEGLRGPDLQRAAGAHRWERFKAWKIDMARLYTLDKDRINKYILSNRLLQQAKKYAEYPKLHFVYDKDSRGRSYVKSSLLNPQGDDLQKGLLSPKNGKKLGAKGKYWLAVYGANLLGEYNGVKLSKESFDNRYNIIKDISDEICKVARHPTTHKMWATADKPWQFLAWCMEWHNMVRWCKNGFKLKDYLCHTFVYMDGSCSGIQHYSAMLRDPISGSAVNLVPSALPRDIYQTVADVVISKMQNLSKSKDVKTASLSRKWLEVGITRDITKKTVMTVPYSSTKQTCCKQVDDYLFDIQSKEDKNAIAEERDPRRMHPFGVSDDFKIYEAVNFCADVIWNSISDVIVSAKLCMGFITDVAGEVARRNETLIHISPTGFPVYQKIYKTESKRITTFLMGRTDLSINYNTDNVNVHKMKTASAPNFVHSMDAAHLDFTVSKMHDRGITDIAVIHDSFGTHACDIDQMNYIIRDEFVKMYLEHDVLADFLESNKVTAIKGFKIKAPEKLGLDLNVVNDSDYFFS